MILSANNGKYITAKTLCQLKNDKILNFLNFLGKFEKSKFAYKIDNYNLD